MKMLEIEEKEEKEFVPMLEQNVQTELSIHNEEEERIDGEDVCVTIKRSRKNPEAITAAQLLNMNIKQVPSLIDPIIPKTGLMAVVGPSDTGKSRLLLQLCTDIVLNDRFLGFPINSTHKSALYVSTEDEEDSLSCRLQRLQGCEKKKLENLSFLFDSANLLQNIDAKLTEHKVDIVVIDTFTDVYRSEMNQINKVRTFLEDYRLLARKHKCLIVFNHHTGKNAEEKPPSKANAVGSVGFEGKPRLVIELRPDYTNPGKRHFCIVKANDLSNEYKTKSYELDYDNELGFTRSGIRKDFSELAKPKLFKPIASKAKEKLMAYELHKKGKSYRQIADDMKKLGIPASKTTIAEWIKELSGLNTVKEDPDTGQVKEQEMEDNVPETDELTIMADEDEPNEDCSNVQLDDK